MAYIPKAKEGEFKVGGNALQRSIFFALKLQKEAKKRKEEQS